MAHQHPVALGVEEVALEERHDLEVLGLRQRRERVEALRQPADEPLGRIRTGGRVPQLGPQQPQRPGRIGEAEAVAVERVVDR